MDDDDKRYKTEFKKRLKAARIEAGYKTAKLFAAALGIPDARYRKYERDDSPSILPGLQILMQISVATRKSLSWLITGESRWPPKSD